MGVLTALAALKRPSTVIDAFYLGSESNSGRPADANSATCKAFKGKQYLDDSQSVPLHHLLVMVLDARLWLLIEGASVTGAKVLLL